MVTHAADLVVMDILIAFFYKDHSGTISVNRFEW